MTLLCLNWTKVGLKVQGPTERSGPGQGLNWTKVGLKGDLPPLDHIVAAGLNWTKVGLKGRAFRLVAV